MPYKSTISLLTLARACVAPVLATDVLATKFACQRKAVKLEHAIKEDAKEEVACPLPLAPCRLPAAACPLPLAHIWIACHSSARRVIPHRSNPCR